MNSMLPIDVTPDRSTEICVVLRKTQAWPCPDRRGPGEASAAAPPIWRLPRPLVICQRAGRERRMIMTRHIEGRRSERIAWLLEELGVPYELDYIAGDVPGSLL